MDRVTTDSCAAEEDEYSDWEVLCLKRVGGNSDWLLLFENAEVQSFFFFFANASSVYE